MAAMRYLDPLQGLRESMMAMRANDPFRELRDSMTALRAHDPMKELREAMAARDRELRQSFAALRPHDFMKELRETMAARDRELRQSMAALRAHDPLRQLRESMTTARLLDPLKDLRESIATLRAHDPLKEIRESVLALQLNQGARALGPQTVFNIISPDKWPLAYEELAKSFTSKSDTAVAVDSTTVTYAEIQRAASGIADRVLGEAASLDLEQLLNLLIAEVRGLKNSPLQKILTWLVFPLIVTFLMAVVAPVADFYIKERLNADKRGIEKQFKRQVVESVGPSERLKRFRYVSADVLNVRIKPSTKAPRIAQLHFGQVVFLIMKDRNWSLIQWSSQEDDVRLQGWVFSTYLRPFK